MTITFYLILALVGAALLGFATAWFWQVHYIQKNVEEVKELEAELKDERLAFGRLQVENDTQKLSIENRQKLMQNLENQCFEMEQKIRKAEYSSEILRDEKHRLMAELDLLMRENEAIREMPELDFDIEVAEDEEGNLDFRTKAKKLVKAF